MQRLMVMFISLKFQSQGKLVVVIKLILTFYQLVNVMKML
eukprot:UN09751